VEVDWEVEIGPGAPIIDAYWDGFVDLRVTPALVRQLPEVNNLPALGDVLVRLNGPSSPIWTSKCDVWPVLDPDELDPYELSATARSALYGWACYIDLLPRSDQQWIVPEMAVASCKYLCWVLHAVSQPCCRVDLVVRSAVIAPGKTDNGITAYLTACGLTKAEAGTVLQTALERLVDALCSRWAIE